MVSEIRIIPVRKWEIRKQINTFCCCNPTGKQMKQKNKEMDDDRRACERKERGSWDGEVLL